MSEDPTPDTPANGPPPGPAEPPAGEPTVADLKREVERLRAELDRANTRAKYYGQAAAAMAEQLDPYVPPTEEELHDMLHGPRGRPILEIIADLERELGASDGRG
jgi:hypothetical protein